MSLLALFLSFITLCRNFKSRLIAVPTFISEANTSRQQQVIFSRIRCTSRSSHLFKDLHGRFQLSSYMELLKQGRSVSALPKIGTSDRQTQNWLTKPDGGRGWASLFLDWGYEIYIVDHTHTGRSPWHPGSEHPQTTFTAEYVEQHFTNTRDYPLWPQAHLHTQWPGVSCLTFQYMQTALMMRRLGR